MMANTNPTISTVETLKEVLESASRENIHIKSVATITENFDGQHLTDFQGLLAAGAVGFSDDGIPLTNAGIVRQALVEARKITPYHLHEEDPISTAYSVLTSILPKSISYLWRDRCGRIQHGCPRCHDCL